MNLDPFIATALTFLFAVIQFDTHAVNPPLIPGLPFDTLKDLTPLMMIGTGGMALVANVAQPYKSFLDVVAAAKAKPGSVAYGTIGAGSIGHLTMAQLGNQLGVEFNQDVSGAPGAELDAFVRREVSRWAKVIKDNNIKSGDY